MKKFLLLVFLFPILLIAGGTTAAAGKTLAEAVVYVDHGCADDASLDQCLRIDWVKDRIFTWQWYQGEKQNKKTITSVSKKDILETLQEIFGKDSFNKEKLDASLRDANAIQGWFRSLMTASQAELPGRLALDPERVDIRADSACSEKPVYNCPSRRIEFMAIGAAADSDMVTAGQPTASPETPGADSTAGEAQPLKNEPPTSDEPSSSTTAGGWWLPGTLLALLAAGVGVLGFLVRRLLKQSASQHALLKDLASFTLDSLRNISLALNADESHNAADIAARFNRGKKGLLTDGERLAPAFSEILAPIVKDVATARLYLSLQDKRFRSTQDEQARQDITSLTRENLSDFLPEVRNASTLEDMKTALENYEKKQTEGKTASEQALRSSVHQLVKDQEDLTRQTQLAFNNLQKTIGRLDSVVKSNAEKHWFELTRAMPEKLGLLKTGLEDLTERTQKDKEKLQSTLQESIQQMQGEMTDSFAAATESMENIFRSAGSSLAVADAVKKLKAYRIIEANKDDPARLAELESSPAVSMMAGAERWIAEITEAYDELREPVVQDDSTSRYCAYVLDSAGLKQTLADFDASFFDRLGLAASQKDTEAFLRLWGEPEKSAVHTDLFKIQFLLENMLCPLLQDQQEHAVMSIRDRIVPFCESVAASARMAGIELHRVGPHTDQNLCRRFMDPCGESGKMTQAILNSKIEFVEIFRQWLQNTTNCDPDSKTNMAIEICQLGYTLAGKSRPRKMTRVVCYKDVAWQLNG